MEPRSSNPFSGRLRFIFFPARFFFCVVLSACDVSFFFFFSSLVGALISSIATTHAQLHALNNKRKRLRRSTRARSGEERKRASFVVVMPVDYSKFDEIDYDALLMSEQEKEEKRGSEEARRKKVKEKVLEKMKAPAEIELTPVEKSKLRAIVHDYMRRGIDMLDLSEPSPEMLRVLAEVCDARSSFLDGVGVPAEEKRRIEKQLAKDAWEDVIAVLKEQ